MGQRQEQASSSKQYIIAVLPKEGPVLNLCIDKYRAFRLQALENSPGSLAGSFEIEKSLPYSHFADLVTQPRRRIIVAIEASPTYRNIDEALINGSWIGVEHALGPIPLSEWTSPNAGGLRSDPEETRWHIFSLYIAPEHRGPQRLTEKLASKCREMCIMETRKLLASRARDDGRKTLVVRQRCTLTPEGRGLERVYAKLGWRSAGYITSEANLKATEPGYSLEGKKSDLPDRLVLEKVVHIGPSVTDDHVEVVSML